MSSGFVSAAYIIAAILFIFSVAGLSKQETAKRGNVFGMVGMGIAFSPVMLITGVPGHYSLHEI